MAHRHDRRSQSQKDLTNSKVTQQKENLEPADHLNKICYDRHGVVAE